MVLEISLFFKARNYFNLNTAGKRKKKMYYAKFNLSKHAFSKKTIFKSL